MKIQIVSVIGVDIVDINLFYHFINHYNSYVDKFSIVFHYKNIDILESFYEMVPENKRNIKFWANRYDEFTKIKYINNLIDSPKTTSIIADHDEFIEFDNDFFKCPINKYNSGHLLERFSIVENWITDKIVEQKVNFCKVQKDISLFEQFQKTSCNNSFRSIKKVCYVHTGMHINLGHHGLIQKNNFQHYKNDVKVHHFKYDSFFDKNIKNILEIKPGYEREIVTLNEKYKNFKKLIFRKKIISLDKTPFNSKFLLKISGSAEINYNGIKMNKTVIYLKIVSKRNFFNI